MLKAWTVLVLNLIALFNLSDIAKADFDSAERNIFPSGFPTAEVLKPREWHLAPPPWGWVAWGASSRWTVAWDYPAGLFGIPAGLIRYSITEPEALNKLSLELYGATFLKAFEQKRNKEFIAEYNGTIAWGHLNFTHIFSEKWRSHVYVGTTYTDSFRFKPYEGAQFTPKLYERSYAPDFGLSVEWDTNSWLKMHANTTYGNTFFFLDQILHKNVTAVTFQMAPFSPNSVGILRRMRIEMSALWAYIPDAEANYALPLPLFPYIYWQFGGD